MYTSKLRAVLIPTTGQALGSLTIALVVLVVLNWQLILSLISQSAYVPTDDVSKVLLDKLAQLSQLPHAANVSAGIFWAVVASLAYLVVLFIQNQLINAQNEVIIETEYTNERGHRGYLLRRVLTKLALIFLIIGCLWLTFIKLLPIWVSLTGQGIDPLQPLAWWWALAGLAATAINVYIIWMLVLGFKAIDG